MIFLNVSCQSPATRPDTIVIESSTVRPSINLNSSAQIFSMKDFSRATAIVVKHKNGKTYLLTAHHACVDDDNKTYPLMMVRIGKKFTTARVLKFHPKLDLCLLEANTIIGEEAKIAENVKLGEEVYSFGNPLGMEDILTKGIVAKIEDSEFILSDTEITFGSSGGPLFNTKGELVGLCIERYYGISLSRFISYEALQKWLKESRI